MKNQPSSLNESRPSTAPLKQVQPKSITRKIFDKIQIKCPKGNPGYAYCLGCQNCSVICKNQDSCQCYSLHTNCQNVNRISTFNGSLEFKLKQSKILDKISTFTQQMINGISDMEQIIGVKYLSFGLNKADKQIVEKIIKYSQGKQRLQSKDFLQYQIQCQVEQHKWFFSQISMFESIVNKVNLLAANRFEDILNLIRLEHMQKAKNKHQVFFNDSAILNDQKTKPIILQMLKQLGELSTVSPIYSISKHQFTTQSFIDKCKGKKNLLYVVKNSSNRIYGAYSPVQLSKPGNSYFDGQKKTFLFDLNENQCSRILTKEAVFTIHKINQKKKQDEGKDRTLLTFGDSSFPNLIISQNSKQNQRYNYLSFDSKNIDTIYFEKKPLKWFGQSNKKKYSLKEFEVFCLTFK